MVVTLSDDIRLLCESIQKYLESHYAPDQRSKILTSESGWSREHWRALSEIGVVAAVFDDSICGAGGSAADVYAIAKSLGGALVLEPFWEAIPAGAILKFSDAEIAGPQAEGMVSGEQIVTTALFEQEGRYDPFQIASRAEQSEGHFLLDGKKAVAIGAPAADAIIVSTRIGEGGDIALFLIKPDDPGVSIEGYASMSGVRAGDILMRGVRVSEGRLLARGESAERAIDNAVALGIVSACAEASAICEKMCVLTQEYCKGRAQFGQPIAAFQVLQHRMADMYINAEEMDAVAQVLASRYDSGDAARDKHLSAAKVQLSKSCKFVGENAIQLHGAMGMTDEMPIGHFFKRALMLSFMYGDADHHLRRFQTHDQQGAQARRAGAV